MKNPWTKKNPFLSMWLSGANAVAGSVRSRATAETKRQAAIATSRATRQMTDFWVDAFTPPALKTTKRKKKKSR